MDRVERRQQPVRAASPAKSGEGGSADWRRRIYLIALLFGIPVLVLVWLLQLGRTEPDMYVMYGHPALLVMCIWGTAWLLKGRSLQVAERVVFLCNVVAVLFQSFATVLSAPQPMIDTSSPAYWMLVAVSILSFLMFGRREAIQVTVGLYLLGVMLPWAALAWRGLPFSSQPELLRVQLTCGAILALLCGLAWYRERFQIEREARLLQEHLANSDPLTLLPNRRALYPAIEALLAEEPENEPASLLLVDIDHFKRINDTFGHNVGDETLQAFASLLRRTLRETDQVGRWGGEEFMIILPGVSGEVALEVARRLQQTAQVHPHGVAGTITVSIGVSEWAAGDTLQTWVARTDAALYRAKAAGRNRVVGVWASGDQRQMTVQTTSDGGRHELSSVEEILETTGQAG
ncbi:hypothetical protein GCM10008955_32250 [Deinococcus malanensis]|uniref:GGDEF domain-containing protein n=1 Tax=Deinococcus malanensis TaxID=1706855 RepID=A0ABQ2EZR6_9DEIO|nr:GGDEF domain-containing protein [Deinococcus malanensis]GGK35857.1 hypothetical protein GCM10008955_32250 [Deinococcus malanensis]